MVDGMPPWAPDFCAVGIHWFYRPLHRSCEATSRRAPHGHSPSGDLIDSFSLSDGRAVLLSSKRTPRPAICSRERAERCATAMFHACAAPAGHRWPAKKTRAGAAAPGGRLKTCRPVCDAPAGRPDGADRARGGHGRRRAGVDRRGRDALGGRVLRQLPRRRARGQAPVGRDRAAGKHGRGTRGDGRLRLHALGVPRADARRPPRPATHGREPMMDVLPYVVAAWIFLAGLYGIVTSRNLIHLVICLAVVQSSTYLVLLSVGFKKDGEPPVFADRAPSPRAVDPVVQALTLTDVV